MRYQFIDSDDLGFVDRVQVRPVGLLLRRDEPHRCALSSNSISEGEDDRDNWSGYRVTVNHETCAEIMDLRSGLRYQSLVFGLPSVAVSTVDKKEPQKVGIREQGRGCQSTSDELGRLLSIVG